MTSPQIERAAAYRRAQAALADLKGSVYSLLSCGPLCGMSNAQIGRSLGIYHGHEGHEGHIPRTLLGIMEGEGVVEQHAESKLWKLRTLEMDSASRTAGSGCP
jgi:hypothetical protein